MAYWGKVYNLLNYLSAAKRLFNVSVLTTVQLDIFNTSTVIFIFHCWRNDFTISNQSQHCSEESFSTLLQREEAFMWSENTRLIFFFSSYETLLFKQPEWIVSVHFFKSHHIHLGMDVLGCWKSGPLVHRATKQSPDQQFQNVPFSYIASMHTS